MLLFMIAVSGWAQNSIDRVVEDFSTVGSSTFTSVVERDPDTHKVKKVVKVLTVPGHQAGKIRDAFIKEKDTGSFMQQQQGRELTMTLTCENARQARIYMLRRSASSGKVTIIIKMKKM